jgi:predicted HD superfamily hydrolase involved in NAD metabolism
VSPISVPRQAVLDWLTDQVPPARIQHILGVEAMAIALAKHHGLDAEKAGQAGLMHDLAKYFKPKKLLEMAEAEGLTLDPVLEANPHLLHAEVGAIVARDTFGVEDPEVLEAIANHTLGQPQMSDLSCVVFLADSLEPGRGSTPELQHLRQVASESLHRAVWITCDYSIQSVISKRQLIHPRTVLTRNAFLQRSSQKS